MLDDRLPILVGGGQLSIRARSADDAPAPIDMLEQVALEASRAASITTLAAVDTVFALPSIVWPERNIAAALGERLGITPRRTVTCEPGGEIGVKAVNWLAEQILAGRTDMALLATSENMRTAALAQREGAELDWPVDDAHADPEFVFARSPHWSHDDEEAVGLNRPISQYPVVESAIRAAKGLSIDEHRRSLGQLFAPFTQVAAKNPHAWFPIERSPDELITVSPTNRMVGFPYTKYLNAILEIDQAAAVLMTSVGTARRLGIPQEQWVFWWGGAAANEPGYQVVTRRSLHHSFAMEESHTTALHNAGVTVDEIGHFDFYSCFPAPVQVACEVLGLAPDDPRGLTVTGGLPYAGGPGSGYTVHSLATMTDLLRQNPDDVGMVTGNGMVVTKHSAAIVSCRPPRQTPTASIDPHGATSRVDARAASVERRDAAGTVAGYVVMHGREGGAEWGAVVGEYDDGVRFAAALGGGASALEEFERTELVGRRGQVREVGGTLTYEAG